MKGAVVSTGLLCLIACVAGCGDDNEGRQGPTPTATSVADTRTPPPSATFVQTQPPTASPVPTQPPAATSTATALPSQTPTSTLVPTETPKLVGPVITHFGVARADDVPVTPNSFDDEGRPVYERMQGQGMTLIVEARPGPDRRPVGPAAFVSQDQLPDLQMLVQRPLGNGSPAVCDVTGPDAGGVPGTESLQFSDDADVLDAINDLGCRVNDGTGRPLGRGASILACTQSDDPNGFGFGFIEKDTTIQFCLPIARDWSFAAGDTVVAARARDTMGELGAVSEIVIRVTSP